MNCGFDPMKTCLLQQIKPAEMADVDNLWQFCSSLAPTKDVKLSDSRKIAFIECGDDADVRVPPSDVVHQMPLVAQLLHQLMRQSCKFQVLTEKGIWHEPNKIGSPNFLNGMKWHVNGMRTMGSPYWRSNMGYMCEMRSHLKCHWGVCSSLLGREGPDQVRITGLTILPPPGEMIGTVMILAFLSGPFKVTFLGDPAGFKGVRIVATDQQEARPMVLTFAPGWWTPRDTQLLNDFRMAMNDVLSAPEQDSADEVSRQYGVLMSVVEGYKRASGQNDFFPDAEPDVGRERLTEAQLVQPPYGSLELFEVGGARPAAAGHGPRANGFGAVEKAGAQAKFKASPAWLRVLSAVAKHDLENDLAILMQKFGLALAKLVPTFKNGLPDGLAVEISGPEQSVEAARPELVEGILQYYATQVEWSAAELPAEPDEEPPTSPVRREAQKAAGRVWRPQGQEPAAEPAPGADWGAAPVAEVEAGSWDDMVPPTAEEVSWGASSPSSAQLPGLSEAFSSAGLSHWIEAADRWAVDQGAVSLHEVLEYAEMLAGEVGMSPADRGKLSKLCEEHGF